MELLRIVATLFVLIVHLNGWLLNDYNGCNWRSGSLSAQIFRPIIQAVSCVGVDLFIFISGYFSIRPKLKSIFNLYTTLVFFYVGTYLWRCWMGGASFNVGFLYYYLCAFSKENWFIQAYLFLMLLSPILNRFVDSIDRKYLRFFILIYAFAAFYFSCIKHSTYFYFNNGYSVTCFILLYLIGRYIRLYLEPDCKSIPSWKICLGYVIFTLLLSCLVAFDGITVVNFSSFVQYDSPFVIIPAVLLFLIFTRLSFQSGLINYIGKSCLAVFIFHTSEPVFSWLVRIDGAIFMRQSFYIYLPQVGVVIISVFILSILLDKIRLFLISSIIKKIRI